MANKKETEDKDQLSFFDILSYASDLSSEQLDKAIGKLREARYLARKREEEERKRKEKEEAERKAREEQERREAHAREVTCMDLPLDWNNIFDSDERTQGVHTDSIADALILSLNTLGRVDIEYISSVTGADYKTVISTLKGSIYQNPQTWNECFYKGWETADEYLSGNLMRKWKAAEQANKEYGGYFSDNLRAIERVLPPAVPAKDIYITLGSPWVPADIIDDFIIHLFGDPCEHLYGYYDADQIRETWKTIHDEITGTWEIPYKSRYGHSVGVRKSYGTHRLEALHILEKTLNMKTVTVTDKISSSSNALSKKRVVNKAETVAAIEKQQKQIEEFQKWVWEDEARKERLEKIFESKFGCVRRRIFDGSFLDFPGISSSVQLYPYQKDAVARIIFSPNTLLAHNVGAGKTYVMIAAGQEMRRMGLSKKNLYVVPNNIVDQWKSIFLLMYPNAELLCVTPRSFTPRKREAVLKQIRDKDYDGIIMAYSCFEQIPLSKDYCIEELRRKKDHIAKVVNQRYKATSKLKKKQEKIDKDLSELAVDDMNDTCCFDGLGITRLFVDEAHNFKNVPIETKANCVLGINSSGSKRCRDMMDKVHMIQNKNDGKGVIFATGTPYASPYQH